MKCVCWISPLWVNINSVTEHFGSKNLSLNIYLGHVPMKNTDYFFVFDMWIKFIWLLLKPSIKAKRRDIFI